MVNILYVNGDPTIRDMIKVALQQFKGFEGVFVDPADCLYHVAEGQYHVVFLEDVPGPAQTFEILEAMVQSDRRLPAVVIAEEANINSFAHDRKRLNISAILRKPVDPIEVFKMLNRLREKVNAMDLTVA